MKNMSIILIMLVVFYGSCHYSMQESLEKVTDTSLVQEYNIDSGIVQENATEQRMNFYSTSMDHSNQENIKKIYLSCFYDNGDIVIEYNYKIRESDPQDYVQLNGRGIYFNWRESLIVFNGVNYIVIPIVVVGDDIDGTVKIIEAHLVAYSGEVPKTSSEFANLLEKILEGQYREASQTVEQKVISAE